MLDVPARQREHAERETRIVFPIPTATDLRWAQLEQTGRHQQAAEQNRVRQRARRRLESRAVQVEFGQGPPERRRLLAGQLRADVFQQTHFEEPVERPLGRAASEDLVQLIEQASGRGLSDRGAMTADRLVSRGIDPKPESSPVASARNMRTGSSRNRSSGSPMQRMRCASRSCNPPT